MQINTPSSTLRDWRPDDAGSLTKHANNSRIAANMRDGFPSPYTREDADRFIGMAADLTTTLFLAIEVDGEAVGGIGVHRLDDVRRRSAEIGYWLAESCWTK
jgi:RimJ/RimL family protein N-acetyltransferase